MLLQSNALHIPLADGSVNCCVTSPPYYGLRDYGNPDQLGLEPTPEDYVANMVTVFREVWRVLRDDGTCWLNLGDSYAGSSQTGGTKHLETNRREKRMFKSSQQLAGRKPKDLIGIPWLVAFALQRDGWYLRSDIIWHKPNCMPESVTDRPTKAHEYVFLLTKNARYWYDADAVAVRTTYPGDTRHLRTDKTQEYARPDNGSRFRTGNATGLYRNRRSVWTVATQPYSGAHFATFPPALIEPMIKAGCPVDGLVLDPFAGSGTTLQVARNLGRRGIGLDISAEYLALAKQRTNTTFGAVAQSEPDSLDDLPLFATIDKDE